MQGEKSSFRLTAAITRNELCEPGAASERNIFLQYIN